MNHRATCRIIQVTWLVGWLVGCKWLITLVIVGTSPKDRVGLDPFQMAVSWLINGGDPSYLLTGMILQVGWFLKGATDIASYYIAMIFLLGGVYKMEIFRFMAR